MACWTTPIGRDLKWIWKSCTNSCICSLHLGAIYPDFSLPSCLLQLCWKRDLVGFRLGFGCDMLAVAPWLGTETNPWWDHPHISKIVIVTWGTWMMSYTQRLIIEPLPCIRSRHRSKCLVCINSFNLHNSPVRGRKCFCNPHFGDQRNEAACSSLCGL